MPLLSITDRELISNTPISTIIFVSEMTNSYHLLLPSLLVCSLTYLSSRKWTIYEKQVKSKIDSNAHRGDFFVDVLSTIRVKELMPHLRKIELIPEEMTFKEFREVFRSNQQQYFPVVNKKKHLTGIFSINDIRGILFEQGIGDLILMKDIANIDIIFTTPSEDLNELLKKFTIKNLNRLPVVKEENHSVFLGMLDRREVIQLYNKKVEELKRTGRNLEKKENGEISPTKETMVKDAMSRDIEFINADMTLSEIKDIIFKMKINTLPVVNSQKELCGIISSFDFQTALNKGNASLKAIDIATKILFTSREAHTIFFAFNKISAGDFVMLPVIDRDDPKKIVGVISRKDIMSAFSRLISKRH